MSLRTENNQMSLFIPSPEKFVRSDHPYRFYLERINFKKLCVPLKKYYSPLGRHSYPISSSFKCLLLQYMHDLSDRELEEHIRDSFAARYFCGFTLDEATPDHSFFSRFRKRIGTKGLAQIFNKFREACKEAGHVGQVFTFVDASDLESRCDTWKARDKAIADSSNDETDDKGNPTMNNKNSHQYTTDPTARYGSKKHKIWFGYKRHLGVDAREGLIMKVAITPANIDDGKAAHHVLPESGAVLADKAYSQGDAQIHMKAKGLHSMATKKKNAKGKNREKDKFLNRLRMPMESVFSRMKKKARFFGTAKVQFQAFMEAITYNFKRLLKINSEPIPIK